MSAFTGVQNDSDSKKDDPPAVCEKKGSDIELTEPKGAKGTEITGSNDAVDAGLPVTIPTVLTVATVSKSTHDVTSARQAIIIQSTRSSDSVVEESETSIPSNPSLSAKQRDLTMVVSTGTVPNGTIPNGLDTIEFYRESEV